MKKLKLVTLLMLALFLVACGSATPSPSSGTTPTPKPGGDTTLKPGGDTTPKPGEDTTLKPDEDTTLKPGIEEVVKDEVEKEEFGIIGLDKGKKEATKVLDTLPDKAENSKVVSYILDDKGNENILELGEAGSPQNFKIDYKKVVVIHNQKEKNKNEISDYELNIRNNVHLIIDGNIIHEKGIYNSGHMYFIDDDVKDFTVTASFLANSKGIYVIGKDGGSTLTIAGNYGANSQIKQNGTYKLASNLYLGLYVGDDNTITTDKVLITGKVSGFGTNVRFVYNETDLKNHKYPKAKADDYVIRVEKEVKHKDNKDKAFQMDNIQYGLSSYKLEASENDDGATEWKLKKK